MTDILSVDIIDNDRGGHNDLLFSIPDLVGDKTLDTYYLLLAIEPADSVADIKKATGQLIQSWRDKIVESKNGETIYLPIDFSDEYTGCLKVHRHDRQLILTYGFSRREGWAVDPLNIDNYYKAINDFEADPDRQLTIDEKDLITNLDRQIEKLNA